MIQYRYAFNSAGAVVSAEELAGAPVTDALTCVGCNQPLIARVNGKIRQPHFGHKVQVECSGETYLHRLAKEVFRETYQRCLDTGTPFTIAVPSPVLCAKYTHLVNCFSELGEEELEFDLTEYFSELRVETREREFIPDVSLRSATRANQVIFIEIAVSHFLSEAKAASGNRIIEIPIRSEADIEIIRGARLGPKSASFTGFAPATGVLPDSECRCAAANVLAFYLYDSGKVHLERKPLRVVAGELAKRKVKYFSVLPDDSDISTDVSAFDRNRGSVFVGQVRLAHQRGVPIRNCYLCKYHGPNWDSDWSGEGERHGIYCKTFRKSCTSNEAISCGRYRVAPVL